MVQPDEFWNLTIGSPTITPSRQRKLDVLQEYLKSSDSFTTDPIEFLKTQYIWNSELWINAKSVPQIWELVKDKGINYATYDGLHKMLSSLWVIFRPHTEQTEEWTESLKENKGNRQTMDENLGKFNTALIWILWEELPSIDTSFDIDSYTSLKNKIDKVVYLLQIQKEDIIAISNMSTLKWQALMTAINTRLKEITQHLRNQNIEIHDLEISKWSINNLLIRINV